MTNDNYICSRYNEAEEEWFTAHFNDEPCPYCDGLVVRYGAGWIEETICTSCGDRTRENNE